jgi:outer membrane protein assembly factor BamB
VFNRHRFCRHCAKTARLGQPREGYEEVSDQAEQQTHQRRTLSAFERFTSLHFFGAFCQNQQFATHTIYVGVFQRSDEQTAKLCAIDPNGRLKWKFTAKKAYFTNPAIGADGVVYVYSEERSLYAVNPDGTLKWRSASVGSQTIGASATIGSDGTIFVGANALIANGAVKWKYDEHVSGTATIGADGTIYFECGDRADICAMGPPAGATKH